MSSLSTPEINADIGRRLAAVRATTGLIQADFASRLGLTARAYANYERGEREVPVALFRAMVENYNIDPVWLLVGPGDAPILLSKRRFDGALLELLVELIEDWVQKHRKPIRPKKKAQLIRLAYDRFSEAGEVDQALLTDMLGLAA
jgi:transcriptional regulator with XRE-family HTH domain